MRYEIKARSTTEILDAAFTLYRNHFVQLFQVALTVAVPIALVRLVVVHAITGVWALEATPTMDPAKLMLVTAATLPFMLVVYFLQHAALMSVVSDIYVGRPAAPWTRTLERLPSIIGANLISSLGIGVGFLFLIVPGFILMLRWALSTPVIMVEGRGATESLARSRALMKGHGGKVAALMFVMGLLTSALVLGLTLLLPASIKAVPLVPQSLQLVITTIVAPLGSCVMTLAYFDARIDKEAFDLEMLAADMSKTQSSAQAAASQS